MVASIEDHTNAVLAALAGTGKPVGDHVRFENTAGAHCVVYLIPGGQTEGPLCDPDADVQFIWQVTSVGRVASEARFMADKVRAELQGAVLAVTGRELRALRLVNSSPSCERDDDVKPPLYYCWDRFTTVSTPA